MLRRLPVPSLLIAPNTICRPTIAKRGRTDRAAPFFFFCMSNQHKETYSLPTCFSVAELCRRTGLGRTTVSQALSRGDLEHYRVGSRVVIPEPAVVSWLESHRISKRPKLRVA
jgi:excisionase family DNA binding protein